MENRNLAGVLYGAGGHAKVVLSATRLAPVPVLYVYADDPGTAKEFASKAALTALPEAQTHQENLRFHLAIGDNAVRRNVASKRPHLKWFQISHPSAIVAEDAEIGDGTFIGAGVIVQPGAKIGRHVIVNTGAIVEHDCRVGDFCHLAPGSVLSGSVTLGDGVLIGAGAAVMKGCSVEAWTDIGVGAAVVRDLSGFETAKGVPARGHKRKNTIP